MAASPMIISDMSVPPPLTRDGRARGVGSAEKNPFSEHLDQALEARNVLPEQKPSYHTVSNPFVDAVMAALKQVKETQGMALSPDLDAMETAGMQTSWPSSASSSMESAMQWITPTSGVPIRPRVSTQDIPARTPTGSVGVVGSGKYDAIIQKASQRYGVDSDLIRSVIKVESSFNPRAVSPSGAKGMMQLMPGTAKELGVKDPFDPEQNIMGGTAYLSRLLDRYDGNVRSALAAYNWGMGNLEKKPMAAMPGETRQYVSRIMGMMDGDAAV